ncbi:MAG: DNA-directed RNA polymerase subunit omega [Candidatus Firestonebacteria bacterium]
MNYMYLEKLLDKIENKYKMVIIASKRARQLNTGSQKKMESPYRKTINIALEEILAGKIKYTDPSAKEVK